MLLRRREVLYLTSLSQSTLYRLIKESRFPRPVRISPRCVAWKSEEVEDWIDRLERTHRVRGERGKRARPLPPAS